MTSQPPSRSPLRIVIGAVMYPPDVSGAANFGHRLSTGLARRGHDVHVICHSTDTRSSTSVEDGVTVHRIGSYGTPLHPTFRICEPWRASSCATRLLNEIRPDVVHVQSHFYIGRGLINAALRDGIPLVATNHFVPENIFGYLRIPRALQNAAAKILWRNLIKHYRKAELVTAPTPRAIELLRANGLHDAQPVSCGIDVGHYQRRAREYHRRDSGSDTRHVLFVGRLDEEKHIDDLLRAVSLLRTRLPTRLEIVGDGSRRAAFEQLAEELGIADHVHFRGFVDEDELLDAYARADVFCMPSIAELQSLATMEAMSSGTPVVLADAMALPHLVESGRNGWLYPPRDVHALASAIDNIIRDRATITKMAEASERLVARHDIETVLGRFESLYRQVIDPEQQYASEAEMRTGLAS